MQERKVNKGRKLRRENDGDDDGKFDGKINRKKIED